MSPTDRTKTTRRRALGACAVGFAALSGGCVGVLGEDGGAESGAAEPTRLSGVQIQNTHGEAHTVSVVVRKDGEMVHWSSHDLDAMVDNRADSATVSPTWEGDAARYVVHARLDHEESWKTLDLSDLGGAPCYQLKVSVDFDGTLGIWYSAAEADCAETPGEPATEA
ncbi:hypothetical protein [Haloprofundus salilacus]|uniref:hypothetical protein n=1 Tax=Haloprofundus salilacus TaxID=2876190 RepID=UPI001CCA9B83|nr:hypothetical protein [Haloprofundus salilacus]